MSRSGQEAATPALSICIATRNRAGFIGETLDAIIGQLEPGVEVVVVDGASTDGTAELLRRYAAAHPALRACCEAVNSGVDGDYDRAVGYARGRACWLMTDDDLLAPGAVRRVLAALRDDPALVVVNAEVRTADLREVLVPDRLGFGADRAYAAGEGDRLLAELGDCLTFIGGVVIRRDLWMARDRASYLGSLFVHVGVIFQAPLGPVRVLAEPLIRIRYGNAGWTARGFEIWSFLWPRLIWSLPGYGAEARARVCPRAPWRRPRTLLLHRALGGYGPDAYRRLVAPVAGRWYRLVAWAVAVTPARLASGVAALWILAAARGARTTAYDLARSAPAWWLTRLAARAAGVAVPPAGARGRPS